MAHRLEEKSEELSKVSNQQLNTLSQMMNLHHELNIKDIEISTLKLFTNGNQSDFDAKIVELIEKNRAQVEEIKNLKLEKETQAILICEVTKQKKKAIEDKTICEEDKRILANRLEEKSEELSKISNQQLDTLSQMMNLHYELNVKDTEISTLQLQNELKREKEFADSFNKPNEAIK